MAKFRSSPPKRPFYWGELLNVDYRTNDLACVCIQICSPSWILTHIQNIEIIQMMFKKLPDDDEFANQFKKVLLDNSNRIFGNRGLGKRKVKMVFFFEL
jgi:hypothetical protein